MLFRSAAAREAKRRQKQSRDDDHIVEAPRTPKVGFRERRRAERDERAAVESSARPPSSATAGASGGRTLGVVAGVIGAIGLICSVVLAVGALLVALGAGSGDTAYDAVSAVCDGLVGPLRDAFSFSGDNADEKQALVAWGAGSIVYLLIGVFAQSFLRSRADD